MDLGARIKYWVEYRGYRTLSVTMLAIAAICLVGDHFSHSRSAHQTWAELAQLPGAVLWAALPLWWYASEGNEETLAVWLTTGFYWFFIFRIIGLIHV